MNAPENSSERGTNWVVVQVILLVLIFLVPARIGDFVIFTEPLNTIMVIAGLIIGLIGLGVVGLGAQRLGPSMSVFPRPVDDGTLIQSGLYRFVRHPIYFGVISAALGWALFRTSVPALILTVVLFFFFDRKAAQEEIWLASKYSDYPAYKQKTRKLIPFLY